MQDSITMADVGSIVKVSGSRMATPFGPPRPGNTPTKMPSTSPTIIRSSVFHVRRTAKPWIRRPNASIAIASVPEGRFQRPFRHDDVEGNIERDEHRGREQEGGQDGFPHRDLADEAHEAGD